MLKYFVFIAILATSIQSFSQSIDYNLTLRGIGDNREYFSGYNESQTILGTRGAFTIGARLDSVSQIRGGLDYFYEFGSQFGELKPDYILYYEAIKAPWSFRMGSFPRMDVLNYPLAFIADNYNYYKPNLEGLYVGYTRKRNEIKVFADWISRQDSVRREQFMAGLTGNQRFGNLLFEEYWYMFHNAGRVVRTENEPIEDYQGTLILAGYDLSDWLKLDKATIKTGALNSLGRSRKNGLQFNSSLSSYTELELEKKGFGVKAIFNFGDQHQFFIGDLFYNNTTSYIRTNFYATPINFDRVKGRFTWSLHMANGDIDNQQQFSLIYYFDGKIK